MDDPTRQALERDRVIDITTVGRRSGEPRTVEIWFLRVAGRTYITGTPGPRGWYANLRAQPEFAFHLKQSHRATLRARATPVTAPEARRRVLASPQAAWYRERGGGLDALLEASPLVEVTFDEDASAR